MRFKGALLFVVVLILARPLAACIWDYDTLRDEQRGLPGVAELLAGRFEKRSAFFYRDRIERMQKRLAEKPDDQDAIDNLAVALFRDGQFDRAVSILQEKEKRFPNQYTTTSSLATFYMLHGEIDPAIPLLEKALSINPNAHFGREKYQLMLAMFLREASLSNYPLKDFLGNAPLMENEGKAFANRGLIVSRWNQPSESTPEQREAIDAIVGMIRFGTDASPDLYYALGNLMLERGDRHLAYRAFVRASDLNHPNHNDIKNALLPAIAEVISDDQPRITSEMIAAERADGESWAHAYMEYADALIRAGKDPDSETNYGEFYQMHGPAIVHIPFNWAAYFRKHYEYKFAAIIFGVAAASALLLVMSRRFNVRRKAAAA